MNSVCIFMPCHDQLFQHSVVGDFSHIDNSISIAPVAEEATES